MAGDESRVTLSIRQPERAQRQAPGRCFREDAARVEHFSRIHKMGTRGQIGLAPVAFFHRHSL